MAERKPMPKGEFDQISDAVSYLIRISITPVERERCRF